jgi:hypothetical protein
MPRLFLLLGAVAALMLLPGFLAGPSLDAAVFTQVAAMVADGAVPYADIWDHKPPGMYLLLAAAQAAVPVLDPWTITWAVSVVASAGTGIAVSVAARRIGASGPAAVAAAILTVLGTTHYLMALGGGLTETVATPLVAVAFASALQPMAGWRGRQLFAIGALLALAVLISLQAVVGALVVVAIYLKRLSGVRRPLSFLLLVVGGALPVLVVALWLAVTGGFSDAVDALWTYTAAYRAISAEGGRGLSGAVIGWAVLSELLLIVIALIGASATSRRGGLARLVTGAAVAWFAISLALFLVQGRFLAHYAIPLVIPMSIVGAAGVDRLARQLRSAPGAGRRAVVLAPVIVAALVSATAATVAGEMELRPIARDHAKSIAVSAFVGQITKPDESIWVWGNEPQVYLDAERAQAGRYAYLYPLTTPGYVTPQMIADAVDMLDADPPRLVIDAGSPEPGAPGFPHLIELRPVATDGRDEDILSPLRTFVETNYDPAGVVAGWAVYVFRSR